MQEPKFESTLSSKFEMSKLRLKAYVIPKRKDTASCGIVVIMAIYQIYIQGGNVKKTLFVIQIMKTSNNWRLEIDK